MLKEEKTKDIEDPGRKLNARQRIAVKKVLEGKPISRAMREAGYKSGYGSTEWLKKPSTRTEISRVLKETGLDFPSLCETAAKILERAKEGRDAYYDKNFLSLMNMIIKVQGLYAPTRVEERKLSVSARVNLDELLTAEERILYHQRALELARKEGGQEPEGDAG